MSAESADLASSPFLPGGRAPRPHVAVVAVGTDGRGRRPMVAVTERWLRSRADGRGRLLVVAVAEPWLRSRSPGCGRGVLVAVAERWSRSGTDGCGRRAVVAVAEPRRGRGWWLPSGNRCAAHLWCGHLGRCAGRGFAPWGGWVGAIEWRLPAERASSRSRLGGCLPLLSGTRGRRGQARAVWRVTRCIEPGSVVDHDASVRCTARPAVFREICWSSHWASGIRSRDTSDTVGLWPTTRTV